MTAIKPILALVFTLGIRFSAMAAEKAEEEAPIQPVLSESGKARILENVEVLQANVKDTEENIAATERNMKTVETELKQLQAMEQEHYDLKRKVEQYLSIAAQRIRKNEMESKTVLQALDQTARAASQSKDPSLTAKLESVQEERANRDRWRADANAKVARAHEVLKGITRNLADIQSRKAPIQGQMRSWAERKREYQKLLADLASSRAQVEKIAKRRGVSADPTKTEKPE